MFYCAKITPDISWIGVNDRKTDRFENYLPLPDGVSYNSYLIVDEKTCIIDTVDFSGEENFLDRVASLLKGKTLNYLVVNHMEPDHSGAIQGLMRVYPDVKLVGNKKTLEFIKCFHHDYDSTNFVEIKEGDILDLGKHKLTFFMIPMLHWPESMVTYDTTNKILFSNDAFGSFGALDGSLFDDEINFEKYENEMRRYYSNIVGKFGAQVTKAIAKLSTLEIKYICPSHGVIWRKDIGKVIQHFHNWANFIPDEEGVVIVYGTMYGNTAKMAESLARNLSLYGVRNIQVYDASKTDASFIISDIWKYKGLVIGSCTHNNTSYPKIEPILFKLQNYGLKNRVLGIFGNKMWGGGGVKAIETFADALPGVEVVGEAVEVQGSPTKEDYTKLRILAHQLACKLLERELDYALAECE